VSYSFTITNIGNETIKDQKLWYELKTPSGGSYDLPAIDMPELTPGGKCIEDPRPFFLEEVGTHKLQLGINSQGHKNASNNVTINGEIETHNLAFDSFYTCDRNAVVIVIITFIGGLIYVLIKLVS
jgi:hypothetical protein